MSESPTDKHQDVEHQDGNAEAAAYRRRLRDTEAERDKLTDRIAVLQRQQINTLLERESITIDALEAAGSTLPDLLAEGGRVDTDKVLDAAERARDVLGINRHAGLHVPAEGKIPSPPASRFSAAFAPKDRR